MASRILKSDQQKAKDLAIAVQSTGHWLCHLIENDACSQATPLMHSLNQTLQKLEELMQQLSCSDVSCSRPHQQPRCEPFGPDGRIWTDEEVERARQTLFGPNATPF